MGTKTRKSASTKLEDFPQEELEHLAVFYPFIRRQLRKSSEFTTAELPDVQSVGEALEELRGLEARGDLWIRISGAGNLSVWARERPGVIHEATEDGDNYLTIIRWPSHRRLKERAEELGGADPVNSSWRMALSPDPRTVRYRLRWTGAKLEAAE